LVRPFGMGVAVKYRWRKCVLGLAIDFEGELIMTFERCTDPGHWAAEDRKRESKDRVGAISRSFLVLHTSGSCPAVKQAKQHGCGRGEC